jgi:hypothetical protein
MVKERDNTDWRNPLIEYSQVPDNIVSRKVQRQTLKCTLVDDTLYRQTMDGLLLKCLDQEEARVAMGEVHTNLPSR